MAFREPDQRGNRQSSKKRVPRGSEDCTPSRAVWEFPRQEWGGRFEWGQEWVGAEGVGGGRWLPGRQSN